MNSTVDGNPHWTKKFHKGSKGKKTYKGSSKSAAASATVARAVSAALKSRGLSKQAIQVKHTILDSYTFGVSPTISNPYTSIVPQYQGVGAQVPLSTGVNVIGQDITCKYIQFRAMFNNSSAAGPHGVRLIFVEDLQPNLALTLWANTTSNQNLLQQGDWAGLYDSTTPRRFKVLWDKISYMGCPANSSDNVEIMEGKIDLYNKVMSYVPNSAVTTAILPQNVSYGYFLVADGAFTNCLSIHVDFAFTNV